MQNWDTTDENSLDPSSTCPNIQDYKDALLICRKLEIPISYINFSKEYWVWVFEAFLREVEVGRTPNPDVGCNRYIKFGEFAKKFLKARVGDNDGKQQKEARGGGSGIEGGGFKADWIATGHYARVERGDGMHTKLLKGEFLSFLFSHYSLDLLYVVSRGAEIPQYSFDFPQQSIETKTKPTTYLTFRKPSFHG
jgi:tRNA-specific 2-thiouridylase